MNFGSKLFPLECTQAKKLTDGRLVHPHVRRTLWYPKSSPWASSGELKKAPIYHWVDRETFPVPYWMVSDSDPQSYVLYLCLSNHLGLCVVNVSDIWDFRIWDPVVVFITLPLFCDLERTMQYQQKAWIKDDTNSLSPCLTLLLNGQWGPPYWNNTD